MLRDSLLGAGLTASADTDTVHMLQFISLDKSLRVQQYGASSVLQ